MPQADSHWTRSQTYRVVAKFMVYGNPRDLRLGKGVGEATHGGTAGDTATAEVELILVHNYGGVPATQRRDRISQKT